jgi:hypothetical protein
VLCNPKVAARKVPGPMGVDEVMPVADGEAGALARVT